MKFFPIAFVLALLLAWGAGPQTARAADDMRMNDKTAAKQALAVAESWLALVDGGAYEQSWEEAASLFRKHVEKAEFTKSLNAVREPLGQLDGRVVESAVYATELPGAPDGHYVVIQYKTQFANKKNAVETVTPMLDQDGTWRVSGYYIK